MSQQGIRGELGGKMAAFATRDSMKGGFLYYLHECGGGGYGR